MVKKKELLKLRSNDRNRRLSTRFFPQKSYVHNFKLGPALLEISNVGISAHVEKLSFFQKAPSLLTS